MAGNCVGRNPAGGELTTGGIDLPDRYDVDEPADFGNTRFWDANDTGIRDVCATDAPAVALYPPPDTREIAAFGSGSLLVTDAVANEPEVDA